jgi:ABC-type phosphate transport system permease subunit
MMVFNFSKQPSDELKIEANSATIVVLLLIVLSINAIGILLRNRFERNRG